MSTCACPSRAAGALKRRTKPRSAPPPAPQQEDAERELLAPRPACLFTDSGEPESQSWCVFSPHAPAAACCVPVTLETQPTWIPIAVGSDVAAHGSQGCWSTVCRGRTGLESWDGSACVSPCFRGSPGLLCGLRLGIHVPLPDLPVHTGMSKPQGEDPCQCRQTRQDVHTPVWLGAWLGEGGEGSGCHKA